jgi:DNA-binding response OmpR family regulator
VTANAPFDLMITNTHMPRMNGAELVAEVRAAFPGLPILHLDDLSRPDHGALPADVPNLYKPFRLEALVDRVKSLLESRLAE